MVKKKDNQDLLEKIHNSNSIAEVKKLLSSEEHWEVVDGQQRLTSILILLKALEETDIKYSIEYDVVEKSGDFINNIRNNIEKAKAEEDINLSHIYDAYETIKTFLEENNLKNKDFREVISENVKFVWYEAEEENSLEIFKRLNVGKIALTESELIKALFLSLIHI